MKELFEKVAERLQTLVPELEWVDWEIGQLKVESNSFPLGFPAALVDIESVEWSNTLNNLQEGAVTLAVRVVFGISKDFTAYVPDTTATAQQLLLLNKVQSALQGFKSDSFRELNRTKATFEYREDGYKAANMYYQTTVTDKEGMPEYISVTVDDVAVKGNIA